MGGYSKEDSPFLLQYFMISISEFQKIILDHYSANKRDFPWRNIQNSYYIFLSEVMLQQTQTSRVVSKYLEFLELFPTIQDLAKASLATILTHWNGLGYNRRAKFLWMAAQQIVEKHSGIFPEDYESIDLLPGVGPYTARAIYTFSFNKPAVFIETNIRTVFIHFFFHDSQTVSDKEIVKVIESALPHTNYRDWYYALMDYGNYLKSEKKSYFHKQKGHTKQSKFKGSKRYVRGYILRKLVSDGKLDITEIIIPGYQAETIQEVVNNLLAESLAKKRTKSILVLP